MAARAPAAPYRARTARGSVLPPPTPAHTAGLGGTLLSATSPRILSFAGVTLLRGGRGAAKPAELGPRYQERAGQQQV